MGVVARRRQQLAGGVLLLMVVGLMLTAPDASAHAVLQSSTPAAGSTIRPGEPLRSVELKFDEPVEVTLGSLQVVGSDGRRVDAGSVTHPAGAADRIEVQLHGSLGEGSYLVLWRVVSADSHPVHGSFTFALGHPSTVAALSVVNSPSSIAVASGSARFTGYLGLLLAVGLFTFVLFCSPDLWVVRRTRVVWASALIVAAVGTVATFGFQAAQDVGGTWGAALDPTNLRALGDTRLGHAHAARLVLLLILTVAARRRSRIDGRSGALTAAGLLLCVGTVAVEGHGGRDALSLVVDVAHLTAAGAWLGGLVALLVLVLPGYRPRGAEPVPRPDDPGPASGTSAGGTALAVLPQARVEPMSWSPVRRFSAVAACSVAVLVATGVVQALRQVPEWGALTGTNYGHELLVKIALVLLVLAAGGVSSSLLHTRLGRIGPTRRARALMASAGFEMVGAVLVLLITSALVATTPAAAAYRPAQDRTVSAGPVTLEVSVISPAARTVDLHLYAYGPDGTLADVPRITAEADPPAGANALGPISVPLLEVGVGHFVASRLLLPRTGQWQLTLVVQTGEFDAYPTTTSLIVR